MKSLFSQPRNTITLFAGVSRNSERAIRPMNDSVRTPEGRRLLRGRRNRAKYSREITDNGTRVHRTWRAVAPQANTIRITGTPTLRWYVDVVFADKRDRLTEIPSKHVRSRLHF
jgi:hypothetical protein